MRHMMTMPNKAPTTRPSIKYSMVSTSHMYWSRRGSRGSAPPAAIEIVTYLTLPALFSFPRHQGRLNFCWHRTPGLSPLRGSLRAARRRGYHYLWTRSLRKACRGLLGWMVFTLRTLLGRLFMRETRTGGLGASSARSLVRVCYSVADY